MTNSETGETLTAPLSRSWALSPPFHTRRYKPVYPVLYPGVVGVPRAIPGWYASLLPKEASNVPFFGRNGHTEAHTGLPGMVGGVPPGIYASHPPLVGR